MGNIVTTIKRFLSNKNTVTIIGVLLGIVVLYIGYNYRVKTAVETISIPYAKKAISPTSKITSEDVGTMEVLKSMANSSKTLLKSYNDVISQSKTYCASERSAIPEGSFFYTDQVKECSAINSNVLDNMPEGYRPITLDVNLQKTYGNSMYPGDYIDLYIRTQDDSGKLIYGEFITKLPILDVRDSNSQSLFFGNANTNSTVPAILLFAVPNYDASGTNLYLLLSKATRLPKIELVPVPGNRSYTNEVGETKVSSEYLKNLILEQTAAIPDEVIPDAG